MSYLRQLVGDAELGRAIVLDHGRVKRDLQCGHVRIAFPLGHLERRLAPSLTGLLRSMEGGASAFLKLAFDGLKQVGRKIAVMMFSVSGLTTHITRCWLISVRNV